MAIQFQSLHKLFGARVAGVDLSMPGDDVFTALQAGIYQHGFVLAREQRLDPAAAVALARRLGSPQPGFRPEFSHPDFAELTLLGNIEENGKVVTYLNTQGVEWHTDATGSGKPPGVTMLYAVETPKRGGDTMLSTSVAAYRELSDEARSELEHFTVVHSFNAHNDKVAEFAGTSANVQHEALRSRYPDTADPIVQIHPVTGEKHLYISHQLVRQVTGMSFDTGMTRVMSIVEHMTQPRYVYRHHWEPGDLIIFDNRACMHSATEYDYEDECRLMYQIIVAGGE